MNYLKKFENNKEENYDDEIKDIQSILIDLKDEFPYIEGDIYQPSGPDEPFDIILQCKNILRARDIENDGKKFTLEYSKEKVKFINHLIKIIEQLENALHMKASIINLWQWDEWNDTQITISLYEVKSN